MKTEQERNGDLYDLFVAPSASIVDIAAMDLAILTEQIHELRNHETDALAMSDEHIAQRIHDFAIAENKKGD